MNEPLLIIVGLTLGLLAGLFGAGWLIVPRLVRTAPPVAVDPLLQLNGQIGVVSTWLAITTQQFDTLTERYAALEVKYAHCEARAEEVRSKHEVVTQKLTEANTTVLAGQAAAFAHIDMIYRTLESTQAGQLAVPGLKERDPRYRAGPPPP